LFGQVLKTRSFLKLESTTRARQASPKDAKNTKKNLMKHKSCEGHEKKFFFPIKSTIKALYECQKDAKSKQRALARQGFHGKNLKKIMGKAIVQRDTRI